MEKEDLIIEFHKKINQVEERFFNERFERHEYLENKYGDELDLKNEVITFPFKYEFYINGHKCKIEMAGEIKVIE